MSFKKQAVTDASSEVVEAIKTEQLSTDKKVDDEKPKLASIAKNKT